MFLLSLIHIVEPGPKNGDSSVILSKRDVSADCGTASLLISTSALHGTSSKNQRNNLWRWQKAEVTQRYRLYKMKNLLVDKQVNNKRPNNDSFIFWSFLWGSGLLLGRKWPLHNQYDIVIAGLLSRLFFSFFPGTMITPLQLQWLSLSVRVELEPLRSPLCELHHTPVRTKFI